MPSAHVEGRFAGGPGVPSRPALADFYVTGTLDESQPQPDVRDVTGREPRPFGQWAQAHAAAF
jgi:hypothetical protein